mgnify:CR=1 FL=1
MNNYTFIDDSEDIKTYHLRSLFSSYFDNPLMTKVKDEDKYSVYMVEINTNTFRTKRYIICFAEMDSKPIKHKIRLDSLQYKILQTRTLTNAYNLNIHTYKKNRNHMFSKYVIKMVNKKNNTSEYEVENNMGVHLFLLDDKNRSYNNSGNMLSAIETYNTIITFD